MISMTAFGKLAGGTPDYFQLNVIVRTKAGYLVMSETQDKNGKRKRLSKPYKTRGEAQKRLNIIEYLKKTKETK